MNAISLLLTHLQAAIAARAARDRALTVLLVALWARLARMRARIERLIAQWRAGTLPKKRAPQAKRAGAARSTPKFKFPTMPGWLRRRMGHEVGAYAGQLAHVLTQDEYQLFLAEVPQAARILRPLFRMLTPDPLPEVARRVLPAVALVVDSVLSQVGVVVAPGSQILDG